MNKIGLFPSFTKLTLADKQIVEKYLYEFQPIVSELNFNELFIWRNYYQVYLSIINNNLCIKINEENDEYFYPIIGNFKINETVKQLFLFCKKNNIQLKFTAVTDNFLTKIDCFKNIFVEEYFCFHDYLYKTIDLINLAGSKFDAKRNFIKQFNANYKYIFLPITKEIINECKEFVIDWHKQIKLLKKSYFSFEEEHATTLELLNHYFELDLIGAVIKINNKIVAITVASKLNDNTALIHIEKAFREYKGIYQTINQMFCKNMLYNFDYINREQDLCDEGLRKAKLSYNPYKIIEKKVVVIKQI